MVFNASDIGAQTGVGLKKRSKASRLPGFGGKAIARGSDDSFGRQAIYGAKDGRDRFGRADEITGLDF